MLPKYFSFRPFSEAEAWTLFKVVAIGEAVGWSVLISGIILAHFLKSNLSVLIAGQFHGILFLIYLSVTLLVSPSLGWRPKKIIGALLSSVPPYGTLVFELWQARVIRKRQLKITMHNLYLRRLVELAA